MVTRKQPDISAPPHPSGANQETADYIQATISSAKSGSVDAAKEALSLFRGAVDSRQIDGIDTHYRSLAEYIADCVSRFEESDDIERALGVAVQRGRGAPPGGRKTDETSYAAILIALQRHLGSAEKAKGEVLKAEADKRGKSTLSKRKLDDIYATYAPMRTSAHDDLVSMMSARHRRILAQFIAKTRRAL